MPAIPANPATIIMLFRSSVYEWENAHSVSLIYNEINRSVKIADAKNGKTVATPLSARLYTKMSKPSISFTLFACGRLSRKAEAPPESLKTRPCGSAEWYLDG
jgi:hypothetical protein